VGADLSVVEVSFLTWASCTRQQLGASLVSLHHLARVESCFLCIVRIAGIEQNKRIGSDLL
jgi:hypothetical protein